MAERPVRKRAVAASRSVAKAPSRRAALIVEDEAPAANYALRLTEALEAISAAQDEAPPPVKPVAQPSAQDKAPPSWKGIGKVELPPIRLPIGPPIPWRIGLPVLIVLLIAMGLLSRSTARADQPGMKLPAQQTYPVQQEAPLFTGAQQPQDAQPVAQPAAQPLGVPDSVGPGFDAFDVGIKLMAVLGLAYGSLMLLKRVGVGGVSAPRSGGSLQGMRVVSSLVLAPNRTIHVVRVPGGRALLVGATPNAVNLIADLGELAEADTPEAASFFDVLKNKLN